MSDTMSQDADPTMTASTVVDSHHNDNNNHDTATERQSQEPKNSTKKGGRRPICDQCHRPTPKACICEGLPENRIELKKCHVLVLQHPHELRRKNRSVPLLELTLSPSSITTVTSRRFGDQNPDAVELLQRRYSKVLLIFPETTTTATTTDKVEETSEACSPPPPPTPPLTLSQAKEFCHRRRGPSPSSNDTNNTNNTESLLEQNRVLIVVLDATWKHAKEMDRANVEAQQYPLHMKRVALSWEDPARPIQADIAYRFADVRTTPAQKVECLSTAECVAWVLSALEEGEEEESQHDNNTKTGGNKNGEDCSLYTTLMKPLDVMVQKWNACRKGTNTTTDDRDCPKRKRKEDETTAKDYSYYGNVQVVQEEQEQSKGLASRASFFTSGDQHQDGSASGTRKKKKKQRTGRA